MRLRDWIGRGSRHSSVKTNEIFLREIRLGPKEFSLSVHLSGTQRLAGLTDLQIKKLVPKNLQSTEMILP